MTVMNKQPEEIGIVERKMQNMDFQKIIGHQVTHISWGDGTITQANDKYVWVKFNNGELKKYQYPKTFPTF